MPSPNPLAVRLSQKSIKRVIVVDDGFDRPSRSDLAHNELADFWHDLELNSEQVNKLKSILGSMPASEEDIDDAGVAALYDQRESLGPLQLTFDKHLKTPLSIKHGHLDPLVEELDKLGARSCPHRDHPSSRSRPSAAHLFGLLPRCSGEEASVEKSRATVRSLLTLYPPWKRETSRGADVIP